MIFLIKISILISAAFASAPPFPVKNICEWSIPNATPEQAKRLAEVKKAAGCK